MLPQILPRPRDRDSEQSESVPPPAVWPQIKMNVFEMDKDKENCVSFQVGEQ